MQTHLKATLYAIVAALAGMPALRIVNSPYQSIGVDSNAVPTSLVERVEVLADGGSATYGTDAVAGQSSRPQLSCGGSSNRRGTEHSVGGCTTQVSRSFSC